MEGDRERKKIRDLVDDHTEPKYQRSGEHCILESIQIGNNLESVKQFKVFDVGTCWKNTVHIKILRTSHFTHYKD